MRRSFLGVVSVLVLGLAFSCARKDAEPAASTPGSEAERSEAERSEAERSEAERGSAAEEQKSAEGAGAEDAEQEPPPPAAAPYPGDESPKLKPQRPAQRGASKAKGDALDDDGETALPATASEAAQLLDTTFTALGNALELATPDCTTAGTLRDRVCELAEHICRLAGDAPSSETQSLCKDGRVRCEQARARFDGTCASP